MVMQRVLAYAIVVSCLLLLIGSCKDMGSDVPPPPPQPLMVGQSSFTLVPGGLAATIISGGTPPYSIASQGDTNVITALVVGDSLKLVARSLGSSTVVVSDNGSPRLTMSVSVTVTALAVGQTPLNLIVGQSLSTGISGGRPPYSLISVGDTTKVLPSISDSVLTVNARAVGSSTIIIGDNSSPQLSITITISVTGVLFSSQIQPIFNASCALSGCHVAGGTAPMSLATGASFGNLVGVAATVGACSGTLRVAPSDTNASAIVKRLEGNTCGPRMPFGSPSPLPLDQIQLIRDWISQGARNN